MGVGPTCLEDEGIDVVVLEGLGTVVDLEEVVVDLVVDVRGVEVGEVGVGVEEAEDVDEETE